MRSQRVRHNWGTEQQQSITSYITCVSLSIECWGFQVKFEERILESMIFSFFFSLSGWVAWKMGRVDVLWGGLIFRMEKEMAAHSSTLAWKIPWTEESQATIHGITKSWTWLNDFTFTWILHHARNGLHVYDRGDPETGIKNQTVFLATRKLIKLYLYSMKKLLRETYKPSLGTRSPYTVSYSNLRPNQNSK